MTDMSSEVSTRRLYGRLLTYVWPHKFAFLLAITGFLIYAASNPLLAHMMGRLEKTLTNPVQSEIYLLVGTLFGIFLFRGVGTFLGKFFIAVVGRNVVHALRTQLFNKMTVLPSEYYDTESSGRMISRVTYDVEQVTEASTRSLTTLIQEGDDGYFVNGLSGLSGSDINPGVSRHYPGYWCGGRLCQPFLPPLQSPHSAGGG